MLKREPGVKDTGVKEGDIVGIWGLGPVGVSRICGRIGRAADRPVAMRVAMGRSGRSETDLRHRQGRFALTISAKGCKAGNRANYSL